jgi:3'-phosphoadenosine 5'-phosphosulfate sulfotransferase (PAPS reductase)/FAD synthetase
MNISLAAAHGRCADIPIAYDQAILEAIEQGAWFVFNLSGGKDSTCAAHSACAFLDSQGHPRSRRLAIHADLGRAEWRSTPETVGKIADRLQLPLLVVRRSAGDMVARWEQRFASGRQRYEALSTYNLIGPWSSASLRFCTSELKVQVIGPELARRFKGQPIISVVGLRREESPARRFTPISRLDVRFAKPSNTAGTRMTTWHPIVDWTERHVFAHHKRFALPLHEAYVRYGSTRLSCAFCVLASRRDLAAAAGADSNCYLYTELVALEARSSFSFQPTKWLADVAPHLLQPSLLRDVEGAKIQSFERRRLEKMMPPDLRYVRGWPPRLPTWEEAYEIAQARRPILDWHDLRDLYPTPAAIIDRFSDLMTPA